MKFNYIFTFSAKFFMIFSNAHGGLPFMKPSSKNASFRPLRQLLLLENKKKCSRMGEGFVLHLGTKGTKNIGRYKRYKRPKIFRLRRAEKPHKFCLRRAEKPTYFPPAAGRKVKLFCHPTKGFCSVQQFLKDFLERVPR